MTWWTEYAGAAPGRDRAAKALSLPIGATSPLWLAFGAAASVGVTWWWMTRWTRAVNLEAFGVAPVETAEPAVAEIAPAEKAAAPAVAEAVMAAPEPAPELEASIEAPIEAKPEPTPAPKLETKPKAKPEPVAAPEPDDLTRLVGIGPKLADALAARGITRFAQLAAWTAKDLAQIDTALSLKGRAVRDAWVAQAKRMTASA